jgi:hypothetical protein
MLYICYYYELFVLYAEVNEQYASNVYHSVPKPLNEF